jgi:predicted flavoprotein YhiN
MNVVGVETAKGVVRARRVILAAGGQSYPELGSDGSGFGLARGAGLAVIPPVPALAGLVTREEWPRTLAGIVLERGALRLDAPGAPKEWLAGPVLFTHKGLSGPPALDLSGEINARLGQEAGDQRSETGGQRPESCPPSAASTRGGGQGAEGVRIRLACVAGRTASDWRALFDGWRARHGGRALHNLLSGELPRALAAALCGLTETRDTAAARAGKGALDALAAACAGQPLHVTGTEGWNRAMATRGGVALDELDPKTLACRRVGGLFCAGEAVDLDGHCGGYNLTWAFASGRLAGMGA